MKAALHRIYGDETALQFEEVPTPRPEKNQVLVQVHAATVNRTDCAYLTGKPAIMRLFAGMKTPKRLITGSDFSGIVIKVGSEVTAFKKGDRVAGFDENQVSSHAEYIVIPETAGITNIPDHLSFTEAAAAFEGAHYAYNFIKRIPDLKWKKVLLNGATGAIGSAGLQFLKFHGATVTAVCRSQHADQVHSLGADEVIPYDKADFTQTNAVFDVVFDAVGKSTFGKCKNILTKDGLYISSELGPYVQNPFLSLITPFLPGRNVKFPVPTDVNGSLAYILDRLEDGSFTPLIDIVYSFEDIKKAYSYVLSGQKVGNVVLDFMA